MNPGSLINLLFLNLGAGEIMVIALFILLFFGSKQIPELMRGFGRGMRQFKDAMGGIEKEVRDVANMNFTDTETEKKTERQPVGNTIPKNPEVEEETQETREKKQENSQQP